MFTRLTGILCLILSFSVILTVSGEVRLYSGEELSRIGEMPEPLPLEVLIRASLIASGIREERIDEYSSRTMDLIRSAPGRSGSVEEDAEKLLEWMHTEVLTRYVLNQTVMDILFENGTYNCVSSAVLYLLLARSRDIPVHGVLTSDHAFCRVEDFDVETTTPFGFDPGTRRDAVDSFTGRTGFTYVPPGNYRKRQNIGEKELISLIYQNRLSELQRRRKWEDAVGLARDRWALSGSGAAENDFRVSISNYAADLDHRKLEIEGLAFLNDAARVLGEDHGLEDTASALLGNAVTYYLRAGKIQESEDLLNNKELTALVPAAFIAERLVETRGKSLELLLKTAPFKEAATAVDLAYSEGFILQSRWAEFTLYLWSTEARRLSAGGDWLKGWRFLQEAPRGLQSIPGWQRMDENYRQNAIAVFHNQFAAALNKKQYSAAREILDEAVGFFPVSQVFARDRELLENFQ